MRRMMSSGRSRDGSFNDWEVFHGSRVGHADIRELCRAPIMRKAQTKIVFLRPFSNSTDKMILNERNWIVLLLYFIYLCTTDSYLQCVLEGDQNWMILWYWVCYSNCERNKPAMRRTAATNRVKPQEGIGGIAGHQASEGNTKVYLLFEHDFCS